MTAGFLTYKQGIAKRWLQEFSSTMFVLYSFTDSWMYKTSIRSQSRSFTKCIPWLKTDLSILQSVKSMYANQTNAKANSLYVILSSLFLFLVLIQVFI